MANQPSTVPFPDAPDYEVTPELVREAERIIQPHLHETPLVPSPVLSDRLGRPVLLKCESQQPTGSFKVRGALVRLSRLSAAERARGVVAASAGNHGLGVAWACRQLGVPGLVVLPTTAASVKRAALEEMLIKIRVCGAGYDEAQACALRLAREAEATFVSPFDDPWVMAGNGTMGLEIARQLPEVSAVVTPLGGGGLAVGLAVALRGVPVVGVNSDACPAMARSLAERRVYLTYDSAPTIAEGLEGGVSTTSAALCARHLHGVEVVREASLRDAIRLMVRRHSLVLEGSAAAAVAALLEGYRPPGDGPVCVVLTGRNIDRARLEPILRDSERRE
jgi:threonine dehydratase